MIIQRNRKKALACHLVAALISFTVGFEFHQLVTRVAALAIRYDNIVPDNPGSNAGESSTSELFEEPITAVISLADDRSVYVGREFVGTPDDIRLLEQKLSHVLHDKEFLPNAQPNDLGQMIRLNSSQRTIYIKVYVGSSFRDVYKLIETARRAGPTRIGLLADWKKPRSGCMGMFLWDGGRFHCVAFTGS